MDDDQTPYLRLANLEVLINSVLYNPSAALHLMEVNKPGTARNFFNRWFVVITGDGLPRVHDKKLSILALCTLLEMAPDAVPEPLREGWPGMVGGILRIFKGLPKAIESLRFFVFFFSIISGSKTKKKLSRSQSIRDRTSGRFRFG